MPTPSDDKPPRRPLVSCLTVTENRFDFLKRAIRCFADQTWPEKEMVIVSQGTDAYKRSITEHLAALGRADVRTVFVEPGHTLGALRNLSLDAMRGEILALWDDDDLSHPERLAVQVETMLTERTRACFLGEGLQWFVDYGLVFWSSHAVHGGTTPPWLNTLVAFREPDVRYPERGPFASIGEDVAYVTLLRERAPHSIVDGRGELFAYTMHGTNTYAPLNHIQLAAARARPVERWPKPPEEALHTVHRHGISARPAGPADAREIWEREASRADPVQIRRLRAKRAIWGGDFEEARRQLTADVAQGDARSMFDLGRLHMRFDRLRDAEQAFGEALGIEPAFPEAWVGLGDVLVRLERFVDAERAYREGLAHGAADAACVAGLGLSLARQRRMAEAVGPLREAVLRAPRIDRWHKMLIGGMRDAGLAAALGATYDDLCAQRPFASRAHTWRGILASEAGRDEDALRSWQRAVELDPLDAEPLLLAAEQALSRGAPEVAARRLQRAIAVNPNDPRGHLLLGAALRAAGDPAAAQAALGDALNLDPGLIDAWMELAQARIELADTAGALEAVERVLVKRPDLEPARLLRDRLQPLVAQSGQAPRSDAWSRLDARWDLPAAPTGERPVFVLAAGWRSGSTLMQRLMAGSGEVFVWGEPYGHAALVPALVERTRAFDDQWPPAKFIAPAGPVDFSESWVANLAPHPSALKASLRALLDGLYAVPARGRAPRWGLKEIRFGADEARFLRWLYPDARFVFLVRNPWDAWSSYVGRDWHLRWPDLLVDTPEAFATHWARLAGDFLSWPFDDAVLIRHEDVVASDPPLDRLAAHLGLARLDPSPLGARVRGNLPQPRPVDDDVVGRIEAIVGQTARRLRYAGPRKA